MEFFEKAHVSKKNIMKKDSKSEEILKNQLKQMLHGYKHSDNELIKNSSNVSVDITEVHQALDDSVSVSGFSDLDLTKSEDEEEKIPVTSSVVEDDDVSSSSQDKLDSAHSLEQSDSSSTQNTSDKTEHDLLTEQSVEYLEPISEGDEDIESLPEDLELTENSSTSRETSFSEFSESSQSVFGESGSEEFDGDGSLASKILQNLSKVQNNVSRKAKKRKLGDNQNSQKEKCNGTNSKNKKSGKDTNKNINELEMETLSIHNNYEESIEKLLDNSTQDSVATNGSSPFISITATDMSDQSLSEILGDYKYPTVRNKPTQIPFVNNTSIFSTVDNMQVDDVDSLIPEIGDDPVMEDVEAVLEATTESEIDLNKEVEDSERNSPRKSIENLNESKTKIYVNPVRVYYTEKYCIFVLEHPAELYINGKVKIKVLGGTVQVFGHVLKKEVNLYSPNNTFAHCLKTKEVENDYYGLFGRLTKCGLSVIETEEIVTSLGEFDAVLTTTQLNDAKMDFVDNHFFSDVFKKLKLDMNVHRVVKASDRLGCNIYLSKPIRAFENYTVFDEDLSCAMRKCSRGIICGGKGLGKSTLMRYYINQALENGPVLVIDLDPGQAEFTVAGNLSATVVTTPLLGPNYTHLKTPDISYNIGMINVMDNISRYTSTVAKLIEQCRNKYHSMPWIINTMGMTNNMGLKLMVLAIILSKPTFLIQIDAKVLKKRFECSLEPQAIRMLYDSYKYDRLFRGVEFPEDLDYKFVVTLRVDGSLKHDTSLSPRDERYLNFLAYFGELVAANNEENILSIVPYVVNLSDLNIATNVKVAKDSILKVINGKIVALCELNTTDKGKVFTLQDNALPYHGHGLIRSVDTSNNLVYLVTPVAAERLSHVNTIMYCDWTPELQGTERLVPVGLPIPYRTAADHRNKQHMIVPRRRFNPLQLLKMSRSS